MDVSNYWSERDPWSRIGTLATQNRSVARTAQGVEMSWDAQMALVWRRGSAGPWAPVSVSEALTVPAIHRAVTLISNTVGALVMEAYRDGTKMAQADAPRIIARPNPLTTPREFYRETAYAMASYGEGWWWVAKRDGDGLALSLYPVPPQEVKVEETRDPLRPRILWRDRVMRNDDMIQIPYSRKPGDRRGSGPLQDCAAAVSVSVEAQEWAANFFAAGGMPSILIKSAEDLNSEDEADALRSQWMEKPNNVPRVIDPKIEDVKDFGLDPAKAQLIESRRFERGEVAVMFGIPGSLLDHSEPGSSLTYQNVSLEYDKFVRACLWPGYLEPIEQAMSDLLTRSTVGRFNVKGLLRADIKTRYEVYQIGTTIGMYGPEVPRQEEGYEAGDAEFAPVPFAPPQAAITSVPASRTAAGVRCAKCRKLLAESATPPYRIACPRCKTVAEDATVARAEEKPEPVVVQNHVHFPEGFVRSETTVEAPQVNINDGAIRSETTMAPAQPPQVNIGEGALRLEQPRPRMRVVAWHDDDGRLVVEEEAAS